MGRGAVIDVCEKIREEKDKTQTMYVYAHLAGQPSSQISEREAKAQAARDFISEASDDLRQHELPG